MIGWTERISIDSPEQHVWAAVRDQHAVMRWSAWPAATGFRCHVEGDGSSEGSQIVFVDEHGSEQGRQTIVEIGDGFVRNHLQSRGPGGRTVEPEVTFRIEGTSSTITLVTLEFAVDPPVPAPLRPLARRWLTRSIRPLRVKDLEQLKAFVESGDSA